MSTSEWQKDLDAAIELDDRLTELMRVEEPMFQIKKEERPAFTLPLPTQKVSNAMKEYIKIECHASKIGELIDILNCIEKAELGDVIKSIDITAVEAVIIGTGLESLKFQLTSYGYQMKIGPHKTHLFVTV